MKSLFVQGPLSPSALVRSLPLLLIIAGVLAMAYIFLRQLGYDSTTIEVIDMKTSEVQTFRIVTVLPRDAIAAITDPSFVTAERAIGWMDDREQVIGLEIGEETKAYPINMLSRHEIVDDIVGGRPVAVTW